MTGRSVVAICRCSFDLEERLIEDEILKSIDLIGGIPTVLKSALRILVKPNLGYPDVRRHKGRLVALTEPCIVRGVLRRIREVNDEGEIIISDGPPRGALHDLAHKIGYDDMIHEFDVKLVDSNKRPYRDVNVPGGGTIMKRYTFNEDVAQVDAVVSIAKMKIHLFTGVSLCMKNLFGLPPEDVYGSPRFYLHYPFRLPRCLVDLTSIFRPSLCVIDGLIGEDLQEWDGPPVESNVIIVGNNPVATDAVGTAVMGFNPTAEFPEEPFLYDVSHLNLASSVGLGPNDLSQIEIVGDGLNAAEGEFHKKYASGQPPGVHLKARKYLSKQVRHYKTLLPELIKTRKGEYVCVLDGKVVCSSPDIKGIKAKYDKFFRESMTYKGKSREKGLKIPFLKKVLREEEDPEILEVYLKQENKFSDF